MMITEITPEGKGKAKVAFDCGEDLVLYKSEIQKLGLKGRMTLDRELYHQIYYETAGKRVKKRALHLLEKKDYTQEQLRKKLEQGQYPQELIEEALSYVKSYHYIDDERYARTFIRQYQDRRSISRLRQDLRARGVPRDTIERAMEEENGTPQEALILRLLQKKHYDPDTASMQETQKIYGYLVRRGFRSKEIMRVLKGSWID